HGARSQVLLGLVGDEEMEPVTDDRSGQRGTVLFLVRAYLLPGQLLGGSGRAPVVGGAVPEEAALELVGARAGRGHDRRAADLVELGLVVLGDDLVFADRHLRERVAAGRVLAGNPARQGVALLPDAVDEDVDRARPLR